MRIAQLAGMIGVGLAFGASSLQAQSATIQVTATVLSQLTVAVTSNLAFGNVTPGVAKTIAAGGTGAAAFNLTGQANATVAVSLTLPTNLTAGANNLAIGTWTGLNNTVVTQGGTAFTPSGTALVTTLTAGGRRWFWIGATVTPTAAQPQGSYTGTVVLNVVYQ